MKTILKIIVAFIIVIAIGLGALAITMPKEEFDQVNPFAKSEARYVKIDEDGKLTERRYAYELPSYNAEGEAKTLKFTASDNLRHGTYLKLTTKGSYTESWAEVDEKEVPEKVRMKLQ